MFNDFKNKVSQMTDSNGKEKKEMTREECFEIIEQWGEDLEVSLPEKDFDSIKYEIWRAVQKERLVYDSAKEIFKYVLKTPITDKNTGEVLISQIIIHESRMEDKRSFMKIKDQSERSIAMFGAYCKNDDMSEIAPGYFYRVKTRDENIISSVILGFFVQAVPTAKSEE